MPLKCSQGLIRPAVRADRPIRSQLDHELDVQPDWVHRTFRDQVVHSERKSVGASHEVRRELVIHSALISQFDVTRRCDKRDRCAVDGDGLNRIIRRNHSVQEVGGRVKLQQVERSGEGVVSKSGGATRQRRGNPVSVFGKLLPRSSGATNIGRSG